jgi:hypothetical protein
MDGKKRFLAFLVVTCSFLAAAGCGKPGRTTAKEFYALSMKKAAAWQQDAFLTRLATSARYGLDAEGKSAFWSASFYSPSSRKAYTVMVDPNVNEGDLQEFKLPAGKHLDAPPALTDAMLDSAKLYKIAVEGMGSEFKRDTDVITVQLAPVGAKYVWTIQCTDRETMKKSKFNREVDAKEL